MKTRFERAKPSRFAFNNLPGLVYCGHGCQEIVKDLPGRFETLGPIYLFIKGKFTLLKPSRSDTLIICTSVNDQLYVPHFYDKKNCDYGVNKCYFSERYENTSCLLRKQT